MAKQWLRLMTELSSRKWVCRIMGSFAQSGASRLFIPTFIRTYQIQTHEAEQEWKAYRSLNAYFTRKLKAGMRPIDTNAEVMTSPVDARITFTGPITSGTLLNVKGQDYTLDELLNRSPRLEKYTHGYAYVLYLSPTDYHRIHAPVSGTLVEKEHLRGKVYPVNDFGLQHMKRVLSRNERQITYIAHEYGEVAVVKVGAMNVSSIKYTDDQAVSWQKGDDLAYFEFGSTVVLLTENGTFEPDPALKPGDVVKMGQRLGCFRHDAKA